MKIRQHVAYIIKAVTEGIPGHKPKTFIKDILLSCHDEGAASVHRAATERIKADITSLRDSYDDNVMGERPDSNRIHAEIEGLKRAMSTLDYVLADTIKARSPRLCQGCGESFTWDDVQRGAVFCAACKVDQ